MADQEDTDPPPGGERTAKPEELRSIPGASDPWLEADLAAETDDVYDCSRVELSSREYERLIGAEAWRGRVVPILETVAKVLERAARMLRDAARR